MKKILTITLNPAIDVSTYVEAVQPVRKLRCGPARRDPGGGGINVARVLTRLGADVRALFPAGGLMGELLVRLVTDEKVAVLPITIAAETRENFTAVDAKGAEYRFVLQGAALSKAELDRCFDQIGDALSDADIVVASGSLPDGVPTDFYARLARIAATRRAHMMLDTAGPALKAALGHGVGLIKPNLRELTDLVGQPLESREAQVAACRALVADGAVEAVALTLGADGALLVTRTGAWQADAPHVETRSAVGAGDSFVAGLAWAIASGWPAEEAFRLGVAAGTAAALSPGTDLCSPNDVWRIIEQVYRTEL